jgi:hypothetical protein
VVARSLVPRRVELFQNLSKKYSVIFKNRTYSRDAGTQIGSVLVSLSDGAASFGLELSDAVVDTVEAFDKVVIKLADKNRDRGIGLFTTEIPGDDLRCEMPCIPLVSDNLTRPTAQLTAFALVDQPSTGQLGGMFWRISLGEASLVMVVAMRLGVVDSSDLYAESTEC